tara:strand:+ start:264 stop:737 length:474 start_codon:yes stop_codon:yes gene_type:complete
MNKNLLGKSVKKSDKLVGKTLSPADVKVELLDFAGINHMLNIQFNSKGILEVMPSIIGQIKTGKKVIIITDLCEMITQYSSKLGYEIPVINKHTQELETIVRLERRDLTSAKTGKEKVLLKAIPFKNLERRDVIIRIAQLMERLELNVENKTYKYIG